MFGFFIFVFVFASVSFSSQSQPLNVLNFSAINNGNDMVKQDDTIWVATNGGLAQFQYSSGNFLALYHSAQDFPEISLSALCVDDDGLWIGGESGYLYNRRKGRRQKIFDDLFILGSQINVVKPFENYLLVGHEKGISVFDKKKEVFISTKRNFPDFGSGGVNLIEIKNDTIWVAIKSGVKSGLAKLESFPKYADNPKFGDDSPLAAQTPWKTVQTSTAPIKTLLYTSGGVKYFENFVLSGENYRVEIKENNLIKYDASDAQTGSFQFGSDVNFMKFIDKKIAVGTQHDYSRFVLSGDDKRFIVPGLANSQPIEKLFVDSEQSLWVLPRLVQENRGLDGWWVALSRLRKNGSVERFKYIDDKNTPDGFGQIYYGNGGSGCPDFTAVTQSGNKMYFGYCGDPLREYNLDANFWGRWILDAENFKALPSFVRDNSCCYRWNKIDALLTDKNGVVWGTWWRDQNNHLYFENTPAIFAFDPQNPEKNFRFLLESKRVDLKEPINLALGGIDNGYVLLGFKNKDELWAIDTDKPFDLNKNSMDYRKDSVFIGDNVTKLQTTGAKNVFIGTWGAPKIFAYDKSSKPKIHSIINFPERLSLKINDIVLERSEELWGEEEGQTRFRSIFWVAAKIGDKDGVERVVIDEYVSNGVLDSAVYDTSQINFNFSTTNGSINEEIAALAIDSVQNFLWVGGDKGITRIRLPERGGASSQIKTDFVFPNPYSLSRHSFLSIPNTSQYSFVDIYTISGKLLKHIDENSPEMTKTIDGTYIYRWKIPRNIAPGTYIVAVKTLDGDKVAGKKTKLYKLVVIP